MLCMKPIALATTLVKIPLEKDRNDKLIFLERNKVKNLNKIFPINKMKYQKIIWLDMEREFYKNKNK